MRKLQINLDFHSSLAHQFKRLVAEKRACGFRYEKQQYYLRDLDAFLVEKEWHSEEFPRDLVKEWLEKRPFERKGTHNKRNSVVRQLASFLFRTGHPVAVPACHCRVRDEQGFAPRIFTRDEVDRMFAVVDDLGYDGRSPLRHIIMPEMFRLLYYCGLRSGEARQLKVEDVDLAQGVLTIRSGKSGIDRFVPMKESMRIRLREYAGEANRRNPDEFFFPAPDGGFYGPHTIYVLFRKLLWMCGISHGGRGIGPRLHDLRHTFAVHRLIGWYHEGADLNAKLPVLATFMGHKKLSGTQHYLHLTADLNIGITARFEERMGHIISRRAEPHETD